MQVPRDNGWLACLKGETTLVYGLIKRVFLQDHPFSTYATFSEKLVFIPPDTHINKVKQEKVMEKTTENN